MPAADDVVPHCGGDDNIHPTMLAA